MNRFDLDAHLAHEHKRTAVSEYLKEIVYGGNDGIVTTFAVVAGFAGAAEDPSRSAIPVVTVLLFGLANLFSDGLSMSLGSFLSLRADQDIYRSERKKEEREIREEPGNEHRETIEILRRKGFSLSDARLLADTYRRNPSYWSEFMMRDELSMENPEGTNAVLTAVATFVAFVFFGAIPLLPYIFRITGSMFTYSVAATGGALLLLGILRATVSEEKPLRAMAETLTIGTIAAAAAYIVGTFFRL